MRMLKKLLIAAALAIPTIFAGENWADAVTSNAVGKRIVVDLSQQRVYAYTGGKLVFSTGANARGTARGRFRVQNKIPVAKAFTLGWRLPHWMGIYYAGSLQNGFHGTATTARGGKTNTSLGCIVMPTQQAATLYRWASVGTLVVIQQ
jgi:lipoprotein-anchoring transpeptidase ErfK/SrfK